MSKPGARRKQQQPAKVVASRRRAPRRLFWLALAAALMGTEAALYVPSTGVKMDEVLGKRYVAFKDPDGIAWELYMAAHPAVEAVEAYLDGLRRKDLSQVPFALSRS